MKKLSLFVIIVLLICSFSGCVNTTKEIQITAENFNDYFFISVYTDGYEANYSFFMTSSLTVHITITPKQTIKSGFVSAKLFSNFYWDNQYSSFDSTTKTENTIVPVEFSPTQAFSISFSASTLAGTRDPSINFEAIEASGTIVI